MLKILKERRWLFYFLIQQLIELNLNRSDDYVLLGQFYGFHGSRSSQFPSKDNAVRRKICAFLYNPEQAFAL